MNKILVLLLALVVTLGVTSSAKADNLFATVPSYEPDTYVYVDWACSDEGAALHMAQQSATQLGWYTAEYDMKKKERCGDITEDNGYILSEYIISFTGDLGVGEVWRVSSETEPDAFTLIKEGPR